MTFLAVFLIVFFTIGVGISIAFALYGILVTLGWLLSSVFPGSTR